MLRTMKLEMKTINGTPTILYDGKTAEESLRERPEYKNLSPEEFKAKVAKEARRQIRELVATQGQG